MHRRKESLISSSTVSIQGNVDKLATGDGLIQVINPDLIYLDKCAICSKPASKSCGNCELEYYCCKEHQKEDWHRHKSQCCKYEVRKHDTLGFCMVATKAIKPGDIIASEYPLTIYNQLTSTNKDLQKILSVSNVFPYLCPSCEAGKLLPANFHRCSICGMPLCKKSCEETGLHHELECKVLKQMNIRIPDSTPMKDILTDLLVLRVLLKEQKKGRPISFENRKWKTLLKKVFAEKLNNEERFSNFSTSKDIVLSLKAVESLPLSLQFCSNKELVILLHCALTTYGISQINDSRRQFLYTKNHWLTHSCVANAEMWIDGQENYYKLIIKATRVIKPGQRITINKAENFSFLPTIERREKLLKILGIDCRCKRCRDPTELGTFISAVRCAEHLSSNSCCGHYISKSPLDSSAKWKCTESFCKSTKTYLEIKHMVRKVENELPSISGEAEVILKKLTDFEEYYNGDLLCSSHYVVRMARIRMRQVVNCFLGPPEKMFLCVVNDFPRAFEYCKICLKSVEAMIFFVEKINPSFNKIKGKLLFEKASAELALTFYEYHVLKKYSTESLIQKVQRTLKSLKDAKDAVSIYSYPINLVDNISFFGFIITKLFGGDLLNPIVYSRSTSSSGVNAIEKLLILFYTTWKDKSKEIGLVTFYMEPFSQDAPSITTLRNIILSNI